MRSATKFATDNKLAAIAAAVQSASTASGNIISNVSQLDQAEINRINMQEQFDRETKIHELVSASRLEEIRANIPTPRSREEDEAIYNAFIEILTYEDASTVQSHEEQQQANWNKANSLYIKNNNDALTIFNGFFDDSLLSEIRTHLNDFKFNDAIRHLNKKFIARIDPNTVSVKLSAIQEMEIKAYSASTLMNELVNHLTDYCVLHYMQLRRNYVAPPLRDTLSLEWYDIDSDIIRANVIESHTATELRDKFTHQPEACQLIDESVKFEILRKSFGRHPFKGFHNEIVKVFEHEKSGLIPPGSNRCVALSNYLMEGQANSALLIPKPTSSQPSASSKTSSNSSTDPDTDTVEASKNNKRPSEGQKNEGGRRNKRPKTQQQANVATGTPAQQSPINTSPPPAVSAGGGDRHSKSRVV
jgi:hypothetical protein